MVAQNKTAILCASTRAAATRLSGIATTIHYQFKIHVCSSQYPLNIHETDERHLAIKEADTIIIDEMSMLIRMTFDLVVRQIINVTNGTLHEPFRHKMLIIFGDLAQLPPVCKHREDLYEPCHITSSAHWVQAKMYHMQFSM